MADPPAPSLDAERHLKYWARCLRSLLPHHYTANESNRLALGYFILSALDLLTPPHPAASHDDASSTTPPSASQPPPPPPHQLTSADRRRLRAWILACRHPGGGFCGSPSLVLPTPTPAPAPAPQQQQPTFASEHDGDECPESANLPATCFALLLLGMLAEDGDAAAAEAAFEGVDRAGTLRWLRRLQRQDGSFGEVLGRLDADGRGARDFVGGGRDMRYCYLAAMLRWMLRGDVRSGEAGWVEDIDVEALVRYIAQSQTYDGGIAESSQHEPHAGYAYCAISALSLLDRPLEGSADFRGGPALRAGIPSLVALQHWLVSRQFAYVEAEAGDETEASDDGTRDHDDDVPYVGFNGRCNKVADTCYTWWTAASLAVLGAADSFVARAPARRFLLAKTQHRILGGFSKEPGGPPDVYHSYLGLGALGILGCREDGDDDAKQPPPLRQLDPALAVSVDTVRKLERARRRLLERARAARDERGIGAGILKMGLRLRDDVPAWVKG